MAAAAWSDEKDDDDGDEDGDKGDFYTMKSWPRGICVIINNKDFEGLDRREGTDVDRDALKTTFESLGFLVECYENLEHTKMIYLMIDVARRDHVQLDCFVCCVLSHGCMGKVYGSNGEAVDIRDLTNPLKPDICPTLSGKPKMFILQACQGKSYQSGFPSFERDVVLAREEMIPSESDFLLAHSTVPGFESYRSATTGSLYIQNLTKILSKHSRMDILTVLTKVNNAVSRANSLVEKEGLVVECKQTPAPFYTLRKTWIFGPAVPPCTPPIAEESPNVDGPSASVLVDDNSLTECDVANVWDDSESESDDYASCQSDLSGSSVDSSWSLLSVTNASCFGSWEDLKDLIDHED